MKKVFGQPRIVQKRLLVNTPSGTLIAYASENEEYPGIYIDLHRDGFKSDAPLVLVEHTGTEELLKGTCNKLITRVWEDISHDDYDTMHIHYGDEKFFR